MRQNPKSLVRYPNRYLPFIFLTSYTAYFLVTHPPHPVRYSTSTNGGNAASSGTREAVAGTAVAAGGIQNKQPPEHMSPLWTTPRPLFISGRKICALSLSEVMGHLSFLFMGLGYLETELLPLRVYAAAGEHLRTIFGSWCSVSILGVRSRVWCRQVPARYGFGFVVCDTVSITTVG